MPLHTFIYITPVVPLVDVGRHGGGDKVSIGISDKKKILKSQSPSTITKSSPYINF